MQIRTEGLDSELDSYPGGLGSQDLDSALKESPAKWKFVVGHHAIRSVSIHGDTKELVELLLPILKVTTVVNLVNLTIIQSIQSLILEQFFQTMPTETSRKYISSRLCSRQMASICTLTGTTTASSTSAARTGIQKLIQTVPSL